MNKCIFMGRLTKDPIFIEGTEDKTASARFTLAVDDSYKRKADDADPDWIPCVVFGARAEALAKFCKKGTKLLISGRLKTGKYQEKGEWIYTWNVVIDEWEFTESKSTSSNKNNSSNSNAANEAVNKPSSTPRNTEPKNSKSSDMEEAPPDGFMSSFEDEELPFD